MLHNPIAGSVYREHGCLRCLEPNLRESNRWVSGIGFEKLEVLVGEFTDWFWQLAMVKPELR
jgi:hypothetical protein